MHLAQSTWTEVRDADIDIAVIPVGSTEQHGPHAPLGTDTLNAVSVSAAAASAYADPSAGRTDDGTSDGNADDERGDVLVTPAIPVGVAEEHRAFEGTLWVTPDTFRAYVRETATALTAHEIDQIVFANGHGGNVEALAEVARRFSRDTTHDGYAVAVTWFNAVGDHASDMGHAGPVETSLLYATHPELVRDNQIAAATAGAADRWGEWVAGVNLAHDSDMFTENGVVGDPSTASADRGVALLDHASDALVTLLRAIVDRNPSR